MFACKRWALTVVGCAVIGCGESRPDSDAVDRTANHSRSLVVAPGFVAETYVAGLDQPIAIDWARDGRAFVAEKPGLVRVVRAGAVLATPFVDLRDEVMNQSDRGLLSVAVHPQFPAEPYVYVFYIHDPWADGGAARPDQNVPTVSLVVRFTADAAADHDRALSGSRMVLLGGNGAAQLTSPTCQNGDVYLENCLPADMQFHHGGHILFGKDGSLFVTTGDAYENIYHSNTTRTQALDSLSGKVLRVHPLTGDGYPDNPFFDGSTTSNRSRVYALGLRNPWRMAIDPVSGEPIVGDVGLNGWEELDTGRGKNFGWPCYEGGDGQSLVQPTFDGKDLPACEALYAEGTDAVTPPLLGYDHGEGGASITAGDTYTGTVYPEEYRGAFFFGDYTRRWIRTLRRSASGAVTVADFASNVDGLVSLRVGPDTNLYAVDIAHGVVTRFRYAGGDNAPPHAVASASPTAGLLPLTVAFSGDASFDVDGDNLAYAWDFGDGATSALVSPSHLYTQAGRYTVTLAVTDGRGATGTASLSILAGNAPPVARITAPLDGLVHLHGDEIAYRGEADDAEDGPLPDDAFVWEGIVHHNEHVHYDAFRATGPSGHFEYEVHDDDSYLELCLTVTDSVGLTATDCVDLVPRTAHYTFVTEPPGLDLVYDGVRRPTPFSVDAPVGVARAVSAPPAQGRHTFARWSDGGAAAHDVLVTPDDAVLTASYQPGAIVMAGLVGRWPLDGDATDSIGDNTGTAHGAPGFVDDETRGTVLACDGADDRISTRNQTGGDFTWSFWLRTSTPSPIGNYAYQGTGLVWADVGGPAPDFTIALLNNRLSFFGEETGAIASTVLTDGAWHHLLVARSAGGDVRLYVDGAHQGTAATGPGPLVANPVVTFCANVLDGRYYQGRLDDIRLFDRALGLEDARALAGGSVDLPPRLTAPPAQTSAVGEDVSLAIVASDGDGDALAFTAAGLPPGLAIDPVTGVIAGAPTEPGDYAVTLVVDDGFATATATIAWAVVGTAEGAATARSP
jgi:glucose/arabinose dehydrogenase